MLRIPKRRYDETIRGQIFQHLLNEPLPLSILAANFEVSPTYILNELIMLHHYGIVETDRLDKGTRRIFSNRDVLWRLTEHGLSHGMHVDGCAACDLRMHLYTFNMGKS
jgi:hypothetical protein